MGLEPPWHRGGRQSVYLDSHDRRMSINIWHRARNDALLGDAGGSQMVVITPWCPAQTRSWSRDRYRTCIQSIYLLNATPAAPAPEMCPTPNGGTYWRHLATTIERSVLGCDTWQRFTFHYAYNAIVYQRSGKNRYYGLVSGREQNLGSQKRIG